MATHYRPNDLYLAWLRGPWRLLDFADRNIDEDYRRFFRSQHDAVAEIIAHAPTLAAAVPYAICECCEAVVVHREEEFFWRSAPSATWDDAASAFSEGRLGDHGQLRDDPHDFEWYTLFAMGPYKVRRSGTVAQMLTRDPYLAMGRPFPPHLALNDLLSRGEFGGGMSQGSEFPPLTLSMSDYENVTQQVCRDTPWLSATVAPAHLATMDAFASWWQERLDTYPQHRHDAFHAEIRSAISACNRLPREERSEAQAVVDRLFRDQDAYLAQGDEQVE